jgi:hypothetical protein
MLDIHHLRLPNPMNQGTWFWPDVSDLDGAHDATRYGMWCAILVSGVTVLFVMLWFLGLKLPLAAPSALLDAMLFAIIAYGLYKHSRIAAVAGFTLFLIERIYAYMMTGSILGVGVLGIIMLFGFFNGIRGAFAYQKLSAAAASQSVAAATSSAINP